LPWRGAALVAKFARGIFKRRFCVPKTIGAIRAGELAIDKNSYASFARAGAGLIGREYARCRSGDNQGLRFRKKTKRDANRLMLRPKKGGFAIKRINEDAPESRGGKREKMTAAHVRECSRGTQSRHVRRGARQSVV